MGYKLVNNLAECFEDRVVVYASEVIVQINFMDHCVIIAVLHEQFTGSLLNLVVNVHFPLFRKAVHFVNEHLEFDPPINAESLLYS